MHSFSLSLFPFFSPFVSQSFFFSVCLAFSILSFSHTFSHFSLLLPLLLPLHFFPFRDQEGPIGLIIAPARELALQISYEARRFSKALGIRVACVYGKPSTVLYSPPLYSTLLYSTLLHSTLLYSTLLYSTLLAIIILVKF
jgi:hypothetical protein